MSRGKQRLNCPDAIPVPGGDCRLGHREVSVGVVGGGIAGLSAACILAERGVEVVVYEKSSFWGGRTGAWAETLSDGTPFQMERGFHAFFRQYYNLRELLKRIDPQLSILRELDDYPIVSPTGTESFSRLSKRVPINLAQLVYRTDSMGWRDLLRVNVRVALAMVSYQQDAVYRLYDAMTAKAYLDNLNFPPRARCMLFDVFAHSFFNPEEHMSAAELLMMFHFYFTGNPEGLVFDIATAPFSTLWQPLVNKLEEQGVHFVPDTEVVQVKPLASGMALEIRGRERVNHVNHDAVVLATDVSALKRLVSTSNELSDPGFCQSIDSLAVTSPFAVWRMWLDTPVARERAPFAGTTGVGLLDNISVYELIEDESKNWVDRHGGSIVELHAYAVSPNLNEGSIREELLAALHKLYPETKGALIQHDRFILSQDCPAFAPNSHRLRPTVWTPYSNLTVAGDFVKLPLPSALMERACTSGFIAANRLLANWGVRSEPIYTVPLNGLVPSRFLPRPTALA